MGFVEDLGRLDAELIGDPSFCRELYAAMCNRGWRRDSEGFTCSWRAAGGIVADLVGEGGNYMDWYLSGDEGVVSERVRLAIEPTGWEPCEWEEAAALEEPERAARWLGVLRFKRWAREHGLRYIQRSGRDEVVFTVADDVYRLDVETGATYLEDVQVLPPAFSTD